MSEPIIKSKVIDTRRVVHNQTSPPSPLLTKERGGFSWGEVKTVLRLSGNRHNI